MKERPILFSALMVRALLDGRKTQTRRVGKIQRRSASELGVHYFEHAKKGMVAIATYRAYPGKGSARHGLCECPYGVPGDRLWVKETFKVNGTMAGPRIMYRADCAEAFPKGCPDDCPDWLADDNHWRPSIFMRRYASRHTLEIGDVRVERLNDISRGDCMQEGCPFPNMAKGDDPRKWYSDLWESINGPGSWALNPWVWVIEFRRLE